MTIKILMLLGKVGEHCFLSAGSLMKRVGATMISSDHDQLRHHHSVVSLKLICLSSRKSNLGSKKKEINQNFTANPPVRMNLGHFGRPPIAHSIVEHNNDYMMN